MPEGTSRLLDLPWEIRHPILVQVLQHGCPIEPSFNRHFIESRVRLRNCFDDNFPETTNCYVKRQKTSHLHGNGHGLRATNRQLRHETSIVIDQDFKSGKIKVPFTLDIMVVKDIGVFPTWMSFPYMPEHLDSLNVNIRIVRPGTSIVPKEWVNLARHEDSQWDHAHPIIWNLMLSIVYYAFGCFSLKQDAAQCVVQQRSQPVITDKAAVHAKQPARNKKNGNIQLPLHPKAKKSKSGTRPKLIDHQSDTFNAYLLPSAAYVTDQLFIHLYEREYDVRNKPVPADVEDHYMNSRFYKEKYRQFGREVFWDYNYRRKENYYFNEEDRFRCEVKYASYQLQTQLTEILAGAGDEEVYTSPYAPFLQVLAQNVKILRYSGCITPRGPLIDRYTSDWTYSRYEWREDEQEGEDSWSGEIIERNLARELARNPRDEEHIVQLRILQARKAHGWVVEGEN